MCETLRHDLVTTRKPHHCEWCFEPLPVGTRVYYHVGIFEGDFNAYYLHPECHDAQREDIFQSGETCRAFDPGAQARGQLPDS